MAGAAARRSGLYLGQKSSKKLTRYMSKWRHSPWAALLMMLFALVAAPSNWGQSTNLPSLAQIKAAAARGDAKAQTQLGASYISSGNHDEAVKWFRRAAEQGDTEAQYWLGNHLLARMSQVAKDKEAAARESREAVKWLTMGATKGHPPSQFQLGRCYEGGAGVKADKIEAYYLASKHGSMSAKTSLDRLILNFTSEEIAEGQNRADSFVVGKAPSDEPRKQAILGELTLKAIAGPEQNRVALVNNHQFGVGDEATLELNGESVKVRCLEIRERSVVLSVIGVAERYDVSLR